MKKNVLVFVPILVTLVLGLLFLRWYFIAYPDTYVRYSPTIADSVVLAPSMSQLPDNDSGKLIKYGRELIANTAQYLGPKGTIAHLSNGMNCQNCHLNAGTQPWGNNYLAVAATYPKFRERSGSVESIGKRVKDCFNRSLNGKGPDSSSREMQAIIAYIKWVGSAAEKGIKPKGSGIHDLVWMKRAACIDNGRIVYHNQCERCHQAGGGGLKDPATDLYIYPPLWGAHSYNTGAGLYRLSRFAGYVKDNMPLGIDYTKPQLTDEEAWDVAAFVNAQPRPAMNVSHDWPRLAAKPVDHPFGPYADTFPESQHKFGPWQPIRDYTALLRKK